VLFDREAVAWTEAPASFAGLAKQRFRWAYGTLQCLWKHRGAMLNPRAGRQCEAIIDAVGDGALKVLQAAVGGIDPDDVG